MIHSIDSPMFINVQAGQVTISEFKVEGVLERDILQIEHLGFTLLWTQPLHTLHLDLSCP